MFLLVVFTDHNELAVIPDTWLEGQSCALWPPFLTNTRIIQAVRNRQPPLDSWKAFPIRVLYRHEIYENARAKLSQAEVDSDIQTDLDTGETKQIGRGARRKRSPNTYDGSEEDEDEDYTLPSPHKSKRRGASKNRGQTNNTASQSSTYPTVCQTALPMPPIRLTSPSSLKKSLPVLTSGTTPVQSTSLTAHPTLTLPTTQVQPTSSRTHQVLSPVQLFSTSTIPTTPVQLTSPHTHPVLSPARCVTSPASTTGLIAAKDIRLFTILEQIREEQRHHTAVLSSIMNKLGDGFLDEEIPSDIIFPIKSIAEMAAFDEKLQDAGVQKLIVSHLTDIGGSSIENMGSRILKYSVTNKLAELYNWTGSKSKCSFGKLLLPSLIKRAIRRSYREVTEARITEICRIFLKSARDRDGGRKRRMVVAETQVAPTQEPHQDNESASDFSDF